MGVVVDQDIQCLLCDRVVAEWREGRLRANPHYEHDVRQALTSRHCGYCGGGLVAMQAVAPQQGLEFYVPLRRKLHPAKGA